MDTGVVAASRVASIACTCDVIVWCYGLQHDLNSELCFGISHEISIIQENLNVTKYGYLFYHTIIVENIIVRVVIGKSLLYAVTEEREARV